jgi:hypothetical protein
VQDLFTHDWSTFWPCRPLFADSTDSGFAAPNSIVDQKFSLFLMDGVGFYPLACAGWYRLFATKYIVV